MRNLLLTFLFNETAASSVETRLFLDTIDLCQSDKVVFTWGLSTNSLHKLSKHDFYIIDISPIPMHIFGLVSRSTIYDFLCQHPEYDNVFITDSRDVLLQNNPFNFDHHNKACLVSEGMIYGTDVFNTNEQQHIQQALGVTSNTNHQQVLNFAIQYGPNSLIKKLLTTIVTSLSLTHKIFHGPNGEYLSEQGMLNLLYHNYLCKDSDYQLLTPDTCHFCGTGFPVSEGVMIPGYDMEFGKLDNQMVIFNPNTNTPYTIVHQWDRCCMKWSKRRTFKKQLIESYGYSYQDDEYIPHHAIF